MTQPVSIFNSSSVRPAASVWPPDPILHPLAWDKVRVSGVLSPGLANVGEFKPRGPWDEKKGKGAQGATLTYTGRFLRRGSIEFLLLTGPDGRGGFYTDLADWLQFSQLFNYDPTKKTADAVQIYHPALAMIRLKAVVADFVPSPTRVRPGDNLWRVEVPLIEYSPPPKAPAVSTPTSAKANPPASTNPPGAQPDPHDVAFQQQFSALLAEAQKASQQ